MTDRLRGLWLVFKDPSRSNLFHAVHLCYNDGSSMWHCDLTYSSNSDQVSIPFELSSGVEVVNHKNSRDIIELMRQVFRKVKLPSVLDTGTSTSSSKWMLSKSSKPKVDDPWSLLVCMKIETKIKEQLSKHEQVYSIQNISETPRVQRYDHISMTLYIITYYYLY